jgi:hypothetical protein
MKNYESLTDTLADLKGKGYNEDFDIEPNCLYCGDLDLRLDPDDFHVDEIYRFKGNANTEQPVLYAISTSAGTKGILVDRHDIYADKKPSNGSGMLK